MRLAQPFFQVPLAFDAFRLRTEIEQFAADDWRPHPQGHPGNWALPLIACGGDVTNEGVAGAMLPTPHLGRCPYIRQVMAAIEAPLGRSRLMKLDARAEATPHVDTNYYWMERVRVHVPVVTFPEVEFQCGDAATHMNPGECWIFDTWRRHNVLNPTPYERTHLVIDTVGSEAFWAMVERHCDQPCNVAFAVDAVPELAYEQFNIPRVMSPWEFDALWDGWIRDARQLAEQAAAIDVLESAVRPLRHEWRALWARFGVSEAGWPAYGTATQDFARIAQKLAGDITLPNGLNLGNLVPRSLIPALLTPERGRRRHVPDLGQVGAPTAVARAPARVVVRATREGEPALERPLIILAAPRSGSSLLFETLAQAPGVYTVGGESHRQFEGIAALRPDARDFSSNRLVAADAIPAVADELRHRFVLALRDRDRQPVPANTATVRLLEKTPKNALRAPFLDAIFPDARYVYLYREPEENLSSLIEGWESGRFVTYPTLPDWPGLPWSYLLVPGWRELAGADITAIVSAQWQRTQETLLDDLEKLPLERVFALTYRDFLASPERHVREICAFAGLDWDCALPSELPLSGHTVTPPAPDKWRRHEGALTPHLNVLATTAVRARAFVAACRARHDPSISMVAALPPLILADKESRVPEPAQPAAANDGAKAAPDTTDLLPLASVHTTNLPQILRELKAALLVTTFQAGKLILAREDGALLNTHFVGFRKPMGLCADRDRFYVGTETGIREFRNVPAVSPKLDPPDRHDAVYVFRNHHVTANIDIHEMAMTEGECWYVNTLFSCLCTLDSDYSFVPRWRPRFISGLAPEDRCHLNGLAMVNGAPGYLTALGATDTPHGWRANKKDGGILLDYASREPIARGLSMPHSPRWYADRLWVLESGRGSLATVDLDSGKLEVVAQVPGFTRGLDFMGPLAFIGLSQLRKSNAFTDIPITDDNSDRMSGVWIVNIETGKTIAYLKFSDAVQEIFAVQLLPGVLFPAVIDDDDDLIKTTYVLPDDALREVRFSAPPVDEAAAD
jgi:uncharacterized protein (TIGR03032 family)